MPKRPVRAVSWSRPATGIGVTSLKPRKRGQDLRFSEFNSSSVKAWSSYLPTYEVQTAVSLTLSSLFNYTNSLTVGDLYYWDKGSADHELTCGSLTMTASGYFRALSVSVNITHDDSSGGPVPVGTLYHAVQTEFVPTKFVVYAGQVYAPFG